MQGRDADADGAFGDSYASTEQAAQYAQHFDGEGQKLVAAGKLQPSLGFFRIASRIDPASDLYQSPAAAIEDALRSSGKGGG